MPLYENVFIARQDISGAQAEALADGFAQLIADQGGEVKKRENWGLRNLAYRMNKNRKGHYVLFNIEAPAAAIASLTASAHWAKSIRKKSGLVDVWTMMPGMP